MGHFFCLLDPKQSQGLLHLTTCQTGENHTAHTYPKHDAQMMLILFLEFPLASIMSMVCSVFLFWNHHLLQFGGFFFLHQAGSQKKM